MTNNAETKWPECAHPECHEDARRGAHCWLHQPSPTVGPAIVFWDGIGWFWTHDGESRHGPFNGDDALDDAITDAKRRGYKIAAVNRTRGTMPAVGPQPQPQPAAEKPTEVLSGNGSA